MTNQITLSGSESNGRARPTWGPIKLTTPPTIMIDIMLRHTARTTRPALFAGRVFSAAIKAAPGTSILVTTPGNGVIGE